MNWIKKIIDNYYLKRAINDDKVGLGELDIEWLKDHSRRIDRIAETMKDYLVKATVHSLTPRDHEKKKNWIDCLTSLQQLSKSEEKKKIDYRTMKSK